MWLWGHRGTVFGLFEAAWRAARRSSEAVIQPVKKTPETSIADSPPDVSVACQSLQITWLDVALEQICFNVIDRAFLLATNWALSHSELAVEQPTRQPVVRHSDDNMPQPAQWQAGNIIRRLTRPTGSRPKATEGKGQGQKISRQGHNLQIRSSRTWPRKNDTIFNLSKHVQLA